MVKKTNLRVIYSTFPSKQAAIDLANDLVIEKLVACVNIFEMAASVYEWKGQVQVQPEVAAVFKTSNKNLKKVVKLIELDHPYECPAIIVYKPDQVSKAFEKWTASMLKKPKL